MKQKLNGIDRLLIPQLLPTESGILEQLTIREIIDIVAIRSEEFDDYGLVEKEEKCPHCGQGGGGLDWDKEKILIEKEFDLKKPHTEVLKKAVEKADKDGKISQRILDTCLKIQKLR